MCEVSTQPSHATTPPSVTFLLCTEADISTWLQHQPPNRHPECPILERPITLLCCLRKQLPHLRHISAASEPSSRALRDARSAKRPISRRSFNRHEAEIKGKKETHHADASPSATSIGPQTVAHWYASPPRTTQARRLQRLREHLVLRLRC